MDQKQNVYVKTSEKANTFNEAMAYLGQVQHTMEDK